MLSQKRPPDVLRPFIDAINIMPSADFDSKMTPKYSEIDDKTRKLDIR
jgi:hypothetical protein